MGSGINTIRFGQYPLQETKLNFFVDYYKYYTHFMGVLSGFEIENPLALADKLVFQLQQNGHNNKCVIYVLHHLEKLNQYPDFFTEDFVHYSPLLKFYKAWQQAGGKHDYLKNQLGTVLQQAIDLRDELQINIITLSVDRIKHCILCGCEVDTHKNDIIFYTKLLASEILFVRKSKIEAKELFDEILTKDFKKFPYPKELTTDTEKEIYFKNKTIVETLDAMKGFSTRPAVCWDINFKIENLTFQDQLPFNFNQTTIFPANHPDKETLKISAAKSRDERIRNYFEGERFCIAGVKATGVTYLAAYREAVIQLKTSLDYMSQVLGQAIIANTSHFFFSDDMNIYGYHFRGLSAVTHVSDLDRINLEDNAYEFFRRHKSAAKADFLKFETAYVKAKGEKDVADLWLYLEVLLKRGSEKKAVKKFVSGILLLNEQRLRELNIHEYLLNAIHTINTHHSYIGITEQEHLAFVREERELEELNQIIKSPFFNYAFADINMQYTSKWWEVQRLQYYYTLQEAYEQRNLIEHSGFPNVRATIKMTNTLPLLISRLRWVIFDYIKRHPTKQLTEILETIQVDLDTQFSSHRLP